jgi:lipid-binding SYLF domain-containing protein
MSASLLVGAHPAVAADKAEISKHAHAALASLYAQVAGAKALGAQAHAVLVFPKVTKAGLGIGGQSGEGALIRGGKTVAYYRTTGASFGLQAGAQTYGYAMFLMNAKALEQLDKADGFEVGVGPSIVVLDEGKAKTSTTTTMKEDIYAFIFGQKGLMAGLGIQGNQITKIDPSSQLRPEPVGNGMKENLRRNSSRGWSASDAVGSVRTGWSRRPRVRDLRSSDQVVST